MSRNIGCHRDWFRPHIEDSCRQASNCNHSFPDRRRIRWFSNFVPCSLSSFASWLRRSSFVTSQCRKLCRPASEASRSECTGTSSLCTELGTPFGNLTECIFWRISNLFRLHNNIDELSCCSLPNFLSKSAKDEQLASLTSPKEIDSTACRTAVLHKANV